jgi:8-oxo-dGTP pyrophosphatase MutT (NUDIX family)
MEIERFNLRVYGLLVHDGNVLLTHELRSGKKMTKFPGGGLEKGEGLKECLIREFEEELKIKIEVGDLYFVNDFLQPSAFDKRDQLISFYYYVTTTEIDKIDERSELDALADEDQIFEWVDIEAVKSDNFTFPIDKVVATMLENAEKLS